MRKFKGDAIKINGLKVEVKYGNVDGALKKLRKKVDDDGRIKEYTLKEEFEKPSMKKKIERKRAIKRHQKKLRDENNSKLSF